MWGARRVGVVNLLLILFQGDVVHGADQNYCPSIFYDAARLILRSPFLLSPDPSINFQCHSCIAQLAAKQSVAPLCYVIGMDGYDPEYSLAKDCHCLTLGLMEECAPVCLPNSLCSKDSPSATCSSCVAKHAPSACTLEDWNLPCYETCQQPTCITECTPSPQCDPKDTICANCVKTQNSKCSFEVITYGRAWSADCTATCYSSACQADCNRKCGDGIRTSDEQCDDGNTENNDGCSSACQIETNFACVANVQQLSTCHLITCGDSKLDGAETCDDGNIVSGDGCSSSCKVERGAKCTAPSTGAKSVCSATCGDGLAAIGLEACDDGNNINGDGCSSICGVERGYSCVVNESGKSVCSPICGDGLVNGNEQCDDKNTASLDGCSSTCTIEDGYTCPINTQGVSVCSASCGDGIRAFPVESCDDGNRVSGDGCSFECKVERGFACTLSNKKSSCDTVCGDAFIAGVETCDDGNSLDNDGCSKSCGIEEGWRCDNTFTKATKSVCTPVCGDGLIKGWEECDDTTRACDNCKKVDVPAPRCGDGYTDAGETCDDGNTAAGDGCSATCQVEPGYVCNDRVCQSVCGNGVKTSAEACDDNNVVNGDGCSSTCTVESGYTCSLSASKLSTCIPLCGDGKIIAPETCDDGNAVSGDGCDSTCKSEPGFVCTRLSNGLSSCRSTCGDGLVVGTESCDDSNTQSNDGCSSTCSVELGYTCTKDSPSVCSTRCGDGFRTSNEACDDGNTGAKDGCSPNCEIETGFSCTTPLSRQSTCTRVPTCGDGYLSDSEYCDDGNNLSGDGCSNRCRIEALYTCTNADANSPSVCKKSQCDNLRKDWYLLTTQEKSDFQFCVNRLYQSGLYQKMTGVHVYSPNDQYAHHTNGFVHWHRKWLLIVQNMLRSMGGICSCISFPYWDWTEDAVAMQTSDCSSRTQCSGVLRDWGGGGSTNGRYVTVPIYSNPLSGVASGGATGYCVLNDITKDWRAGMDLHRYRTAWDPSCPIIRRGWNDFSDANGNYAAPLASSSFLNLASALARASTYTQFSSIALGDIHVLPHDRSGAFLTTFISPADPVFLLHHTNIDRVYALWEACHGCTNPSTASRTTEGRCYTGSNNNDGIRDPMTFRSFDLLLNGQYREVDLDNSIDLAEYIPRNLITPGDVLDTGSLGDYAYKYQTDDLDERLWSASGCVQRNRPSVFLQNHPNFVSFVNPESIDTFHDGNATFTAKASQIYLLWLDSLLLNTTQVIEKLQATNLFDIAYLNNVLEHVKTAESYVSDIAATCECMHLNKLLVQRTGEAHLTASFTDVSATSKRNWNNTFEIRSCFHRLLDQDDTNKLLRQYCDVILSNDFDTKLQNLLNDLRGIINITPEVSSGIQQIWDYFTKK